MAKMSTRSKSFELLPAESSKNARVISKQVDTPSRNYA